MSISKETENLAARVLDVARNAQLTLGSAESCTGGMIAASLTDIAGSSDVFVGGIVSYWIEVKESVLGVDHTTIETCGVVSEDVAEQMARGAREALRCDIAVSTTGIAGPGGAEPGKPVGTVCLAVSSGQHTKTRTIHAKGGRGQVREEAVLTALEMLLSALESC